MSESSFLRQVAVTTVVVVAALSLTRSEVHYHFHGPPQEPVVVQPLEMSIDWEAYALLQECSPTQSDGNHLTQGC